MNKSGVVFIMQCDSIHKQLHGCSKQPCSSHYVRNSSPNIAISLFISPIDRTSELRVTGYTL